jgi:hypothetical protein
MVNNTKSQRFNLTVLTIFFASVHHASLVQRNFEGEDDKVK